MKTVVAFVSGAIFALGLALGGMTQPAKVLAFLDVTGRWDPSLAFVMAGAIGIHALAVFRMRRQPAPVLDESYHLPTKTAVDLRLVGGAALFGLGWGLGGYCPGPAITSAGAGQISAVILVAAMIGGMMLARLWESFADSRRREAARRPAAAGSGGRIAA